MARITNPNRSAPVTLPTHHVVPKGGTLETTNAVLRCPDNVAFLQGLILSGALCVTYDPEDEPETAPASGPSPDAPPSPLPKSKPNGA